jgi:hypothetical protein
MNDLILESKKFNLSTRGSSCRILNTNTDFKSHCEYNIPNMIVRDESIEFIQFSVPDAVVPCSFYVVNENNSNLDISMNGIKTSYIFPYGNYQANYFITAFKQLLGNNWNITINTTSNIFTITNSVAPFTFMISSRISSVMGFSSSITSSFTNNIYNLTMTRSCNFLPLPRIIFRCAELADSTMIANNTSNDVILAISNNTRNNGQIYYQNQSQSRLLFRHNELSRFIIMLTDDDGNFINFNGISSFFTLQFDIYRRYIQRPPKFLEIVQNHSKIPTQFYMEDLANEET